MAAEGGPNIVYDGLVLSLDASNPKSYPGEGTTWYDLSGNGNHGTLANGPTYLNGAIVFDGAGDYINNIPVQSTSAMTWEAVVYPEVLNKTVFYNNFNPRITVRSYQINLYHTITGRTGDVGFSYAFETGSYYHIAVTYDNTNGYRGFVNAQEKTRTINNLGAAGIPEFTSTKIGQGAGSDGYFNGKIPLAKIYNRALTTSEILQNYNATKERFGL